ncbi:hypothetical protein LZ554_009018 [Drepanopeziza brunnea f. sp. 'monogermtubi']|nr:hypothetical protein LZ554_009018 [Drepanopeziza brunnea f. sp. 'monogermtubi']
MDLPDLSRVVLALTSLFTTYLTLCCLTPPNPPPISRTKDRVVPFGSGSLLLSRRLAFGLLGLCHAILILDPTSPPSKLCPNPSNLNLSLFSWSTHAAVCLGLLLIAAPVRLLAFRQLGQDFTFVLAKPRGLVTSGLYRYVQHPSYTASVVVVVANGFMFERPDGAAGCWMSRAVAQSAWWNVVRAVVVVVGGWMIMMRVADEEKMLKDALGREWEEWHGKTKRFVPGLF